MFNLNWKKEVFTIPNFLSLFRLLLIPVYVYLYLTAETTTDYVAAGSVLALSCLTDLVDGKIARKFNMVSNLGKILDPIADKLSQIAIVIILLVKFWDGPLKYILFLFIFKELLMIIGAGILMSKGMRPVAAEVWGKLATVVFYTFMITIIAIGPNGALLSIDLFKGLELNNTVIMIMVIISAILAFASLFGYAPGFIRQLKENKKQSNSSEK